MKIFITAHSSRRGGGIVVAQSLLAAFGRVAPENEYVVTIPPNLGYEEVCAKIPRCRTYVYETRGFLKRLLWDSLGVRRLVRRENPDVLFNLGNWSWFPTRCFQATYIQWSYLCYPARHWGRRSRISLLATALRIRACRALLSTFADRLYCQTPVMRNRLLKFFPRKEILLLPTKADVSTPAIFDPAARPAAKKFLLFYPALSYAHKNFRILFETFAKFKDALRDCVLYLTIKPEDDGDVGGAETFIRENGLSEQIILLGELPKTKVEALYGDADAMLFPSLLETLGIPLLEAMSAGVPVIASDMDFSHGNCGDAALYFDASSPEALRDAILTLKDSPALQKELSRKGKERIAAASHSWDEIAADFLDRLNRFDNEKPEISSI